MESTIVAFKPVCNSCGYVLKEFIYDENTERVYGDEYCGFSHVFIPCYCPNCHKAIKICTMPAFRDGKLTYKESED